MIPPPTARGRRTGERGTSLSAFVATVVVALLAMGGLVIDGGAQSSAARHCQQVASQAARAATDAASLRRAAGLEGDAGQMRAAALAVLNADPTVTGTVTVEGGAVQVDTRKSVPTTFLSLLRIDRLEASGRARADLRGTG